MLANGLSTPQQKKKPFQFRPVRSRAVESAELRQDGRRLFRPARPLRRHRHPDASPPAHLWGRESLGCPVVPFVAATTSHHWQQSTQARHPLPPNCDISKVLWFHGVKTMFESFEKYGRVPTVKVLLLLHHNGFTTDNPAARSSYNQN